MKLENNALVEKRAGKDSRKGSHGQGGNISIFSFMSCIGMIGLAQAILDVFRSFNPNPNQDPFYKFALRHKQ